MMNIDQHGPAERRTERTAEALAVPIAGLNVPYAAAEVSNAASIIMGTARLL